MEEDTYRVDRCRLQGLSEDMMGQGTNEPESVQLHRQVAERQEVSPERTPRSEKLESTTPKPPGTESN